MEKVMDWFFLLIVVILLNLHPSLFCFSLSFVPILSLEESTFPQVPKQVLPVETLGQAFAPKYSSLSHLLVGARTLFIIKERKGWNYGRKKGANRRRGF